MRDPLFTYFTTVLYPENLVHRTFIQCVDQSINYTGLRVAYILHDKCRVLPSDVKWDSDAEMNVPVDESDIGKLKKPHWHLFMKSGYQLSEKSFNSAFGQLVKLPPKRIEGVRAPNLFCAYLTHTDPESIMLGKHRYNTDDFKGDTQILLVDDNITIVDFYNAVYKWRCSVLDGEATFAALTLALHFAGFDAYVKRNQFICTTIMREAVSMRQDIALRMHNGFMPKELFMEDFL